MSGPIRVLIVDDSEDDTLLLIDELIDSGYSVLHLRVDTPEAMQSALADHDWDIIICDYKMPGFSGPEALRVLQEASIDIPFILVSGTAPEDTGVDMMRAGAQDFILKRSLSRLAPAVKRELAEAVVRSERKHAQEEYLESEERYRLITETAIDAIITTDIDGTILFVNPAAERIFGYNSGEMIGQNISMLMPARYRTQALSAMQHCVETGEKLGPWQGIEVIGLHKGGREINLEASYSDYMLRGKHYLTGTFRDITERKEMEAHKREFYRRTIFAATEGKLVISDPEEIYQIAGNATASWEIEDIDDIKAVLEEIREIVQKTDMDEPRVLGFVGCAVEALSNAVKYAGGGTVSLHTVSDGIVLVVADHGPGIEAFTLPDVALTKGYSTTVSLGMGYKVMIEFSDRIYLATNPDGTTVAIQMGLHAELAPGTALLQKLPGW